MSAISKLSVSPVMAKDAFFVSLILLSAVIIDKLLRSLIKVPKNFESRRAHTYATILRNIITIIIYSIAVHLIFITLGINITPLLASAGIVGITVGLGARPLIEDLISGLFLLSQDSIASGDYVRINEAEGFIENIGFRTLNIRSESGALYIVPNGQIKTVMNFSRHRAYTIIEIPVKSDQNIDLVLKTTNEALSVLVNDKKNADSVFPGSVVNGIEDIKAAGPMMIRTTIVTHSQLRFEIAEQFRYLVKKAYEKNKILLG